MRYALLLLLASAAHAQTVTPALHAEAYAGAFFAPIGDDIGGVLGASLAYQPARRTTLRLTARAAYAAPASYHTVVPHGRRTFVTVAPTVHVSVLSPFQIGIGPSVRYRQERTHREVSTRHSSSGVSLNYVHWERDRGIDLGYTVEVAASLGQIWGRHFTLVARNDAYAPGTDVRGLGLRVR